MEKEKKIENVENKYTLKGSCLWGILLFAILLLVDMVTKIVADAYFSADGNEPIVLIPGYLVLMISYNRGIAFSIGDDAPMAAKIGLVVATAVFFVAFTIVYFKMDKRRTWMRIALVFIIAGGVGNLIDRVYYQVWDPTTSGGVRDMVYLKILMFDFGVCNFADFFIVGGAIALMLSIMFFDPNAMFPLTKKYKVLAKEYEEKEEQKRAAKKQKAEGSAVREDEKKKE